MQQLVQLRRMILSRADARLEYSADSRSGVLQCEGTSFVGDKEGVIGKLRDVYTADEARASRLAPGQQGATPDRIHVVRAVVESLKGLQLDLQMQVKLIEFARQLPPLAVKRAPLHKLGFEDFAPYVRLHQEFLHNGQADMTRFIRDAVDADEQLGRLRVLIATFCLGLVSPLEQQADKASPAGGTTSILGRIIRRVRGL